MCNNDDKVYDCICIDHKSKNTGTVVVVVVAVYTRKERKYRLYVHVSTCGESDEASKQAKK